ncbi:MAG: LPS export ABC transporter periplasmic protein LptC [Gammaproteobacteria bacterium]|nr:LPS export ABC transporter periplasmic protein LptC [Gammaproteobacteria bacterium]
MQKLFKFKSFVILFVFILLSSVYIEVNQTLEQLDNQKSVNINTIDNKIDSFIKKAKIINYEDGVPKFYLNAESINYFSDSEKAQLRKLSIRILTGNDIQANKLSWLASADNAYFYDKSDKISLINHVKIVKQLKNKPDNFEVSTDYIEFFPKNSYAKTGHPVTILSNNSTLSTDGLKIDFEQQKFHLLKKVRYQELF